MGIEKVDIVDPLAGKSPALGREDVSWMATAEALAGFGVWEWHKVEDLWALSPAARQLLNAAESATRTREVFAALRRHDQGALLHLSAEELGSVLTEGFECAVQVGEGPRWILLRGEALADADAPVQRGIVKDISDRKNAQLAQQASDERLQVLLEVSTDYYWEQDAEFRFTDLRRGGFSHVPPVQHSGIGRAPWEIDEIEAPPEGWPARQAFLETHQPFRDEVRLRRLPNGEVRRLLLSGFPTYDPDGNFSGYKGVARDITDQEAAARALRASEQRFRLLAESTRDIVWVSDPGITRLDYISPSMENVWGITAEALIRDPSLWKQRVHHDDAAVAGAALARQLAGEPVEVEFRIVRPDGGLRWLWIRSTPARNEDGEPIVFGVTEDITARKLAQFQDLEEAVRQRDTLVREVHHRIKNNLQGVAGLLRAHANRAPQVAESLETAILQIQSIATVHGLQGIDRRGDIDLWRILVAIGGTAEQLSGARISIEAGDDSARNFVIAEGEAVATALIFNELVVNAVKHSTCDGTADGVTVRVTPSAGALAVAIVNRGTLPDGFSLERRSGLGTGLELVCALMPKKGFVMKLEQAGVNVRARVVLATPIVRRTS